MCFLHYLVGKKHQCFVKFFNHLTVKCSWHEECNFNFSPLIWWGEGGCVGVVLVGVFFLFFLNYISEFFKSGDTYGLAASS